MLELFKTHFRRFFLLFLAAFAFTVVRVVCELMLPDLMSSIIDEGVLENNVGFIMDTGVIMLVWAAGALIFDILTNLAAARASFGFGRELRSAIYQRVFELSVPEVDAFGASTLITRTTNDVQQLERFTLIMMTMAMMSPVMLVGAAVMVVVKSLELSSILVVAIPILVLLVTVVVKFAMPLLRSLQMRIDRLNLVTREGLTGVRVIRAYCRESYEENRFSQANYDLAKTNVKVARRMSVLMPVSSLLLNIATIAIVWFGAQLVDFGSLQVGDVMAVIQYTTQVLFSTIMASSIFMLLPRSAAAAERIGAVLSAEPGVRDVDERVHIDPKTLKNPHEVRFEHVSFRFEGAEQATLSDIDITLKAGKTYALIGSTGSGKSTIVNLLLRFFDPSFGRVLFDGIDISHIAQTELRHMISYVPQKSVLFSGTIGENIRYGNTGASDEEVERAAKAAHAYDFIMGKDEGFNTHITQAAGGLSGGQKQRITIARALVKNAGFYIFDDSFSALDFKTDALVRKELHKCTAGATVLVVAQRVASAMDADEVIVIERGRIVGQGTHAQLLKDNEVYREIVASQMSLEEAS